MTDQYSIQTITDAFREPGTAGEWTANTGTKLIEKYPYFTPARYLVAAQLQKSEPFSEKMLSSMYAYTGNWILFWEFVQGLKTDRTYDEGAATDDADDRVADDIITYPTYEYNSETVVEETTEEPSASDERFSYPTYQFEPEPGSAVATDEPVAQDDSITYPTYQFETEPEVTEAIEEPIATEEDTHEPSYQYDAANEIIEGITEEVDTQSTLLMEEGVDELFNGEESVLADLLPEEASNPELDAALENEYEAEHSDELFVEVPAAEDLPAIHIVEERQVKSEDEREQAEERKLYVSVDDILETFRISDIEEIHQEPEEIKMKEEEIFTPVYSEDYFFQQGIKVTGELPDKVEDLKMHNEEFSSASVKDKSLMIMMSFTEWLLHFKNSADKQKNEIEEQRAIKSMWQKEKLAAAFEEEDDEIPENVFEMAVNSITKEEGLASESLADIYIKQKKYDKAIEMYKKLSLQNPQKNAYFARKIEEVLKDKQL